MLMLSPSGLAWHTDDVALRARFEEFGQVEEAVSCQRADDHSTFADRILDRRKGP